MVATRYSFGKEALEGAFGRYDKTLDAESPTDPRPAIQAMVERFGDLEGIHRRAVGNDGRIIGVERAHLLEGVDALALAAITALRKLSGGQIISLSADPASDQFISLDFDLDGWIIHGRLPLRKGGFQGSFMDFHRGHLSAPIRAFLQEYRAHAMDAAISEEERAVMMRGLRDILVAAFELYALVYHVRINA